MFDGNINSKGVNKEQLILEWRENPVVAAKDILDVDLDKHQRIVLKSRWTHSTEYDVLSRGTGKSFLNGVFASLRCILYPGHRVGIIGPGFRQAKIVFEEVRRLYQKSAVFQQCCVGATYGPKSTPECSYIKFNAAPGKNESYMAALPLGCDGAKVRGERFYDVIADEIAQIDTDVLSTVVRGFLATSSDPMARVRVMEEQRRQIANGLMEEKDLIMPDSNKFIGSSTAFYQYNHFWQRVSGVMGEVLGEVQKYRVSHGGCSEEDALKALPHIKLLGGPLNEGQIPHRVISNGQKAITAFTCEDPSEGFMNMDSIEQSRAEMSDYMFRMEYFCFSPADSEGFFRRSMLDAARKHGSFPCITTPRKGMLYTMGVDPARKHDNFAIAIFEIDPVNKRINLVRVMTWNKKNFPEMARNVRQVIKLYEMKYFQMDSGGGGTTIRDLLADKGSIPSGDRPILEKDFDEHRPLLGDRILGPLCEFSNGQWLHDANHNLLSGLQHGRLFIAAKPENVPNCIWTPELDEEDTELEGALLEMSSIIVTQNGSRMHWDTPTKTQRKDRYSAILIGYDAAVKVLGNTSGPPKLAMGGWF